MRLHQQPPKCQLCTSKCDLYLTARELRLEAELSPSSVHFSKHQTIVVRGEAISHAIIVTDGQAKMYIEGLNNRSVMLGLIVPGNYLGLMALFGSGYYDYHVKALTHLRCCFVDINLLKKLYLADPSFQARLNESFGNSVRHLMEKLVSFSQKHLRARMAESLLYLAGVHESNRFRLTLTRSDLGELAGITGENAVRVLSEFRHEGLIHLEGKEIGLLLPDVLRKISQVG